MSVELVRETQLPRDDGSVPAGRWRCVLRDYTNDHLASAIFRGGLMENDVCGRDILRIVAHIPTIGAMRVSGGSPCELGDCSRLKPGPTAEEIEAARLADEAAAAEVARLADEAAAAEVARLAAEAAEAEAKRLEDERIAKEAAEAAEAQRVADEAAAAAKAADEAALMAELEAEEAASEAAKASTPDAAPEGAGESSPGAAPTSTSKDKGKRK